MRTSSPGPPGRADAAQWRRWVFPAAIGAGLVTLLALPRGAAPGTALSYTRFLADVSAGMVRADKQGNPQPEGLPAISRGSSRSDHPGKRAHTRDRTLKGCQQCDNTRDAPQRRRHRHASLDCQVADT